ncbi:hypothetical protein ABFP44_19960 [Paraburkholderia terricola]
MFLSRTLRSHLLGLRAFRRNTLHSRLLRQRTFRRSSLRRRCLFHRRRLRRKTLRLRPLSSFACRRLPRGRPENFRLALRCDPLRHLARRRLALGSFAFSGGKRRRLPHRVVVAYIRRLTYRSWLMGRLDLMQIRAFRRCRRRSFGIRRRSFRRGKPLALSPPQTQGSQQHDQRSANRRRHAQTRLRHAGFVRCRDRRAAVARHNRGG